MAAGVARRGHGSAPGGKAVRQRNFGGAGLFNSMEALSISPVNLALQRAVAAGRCGNAAVVFPAESDKIPSPKSCRWNRGQIRDQAVHVAEELPAGARFRKRLRKNGSRPKRPKCACGFRYFDRSHLLCSRVLCGVGRALMKLGAARAAAGWLQFFENRVAAERVRRRNGRGSSAMVCAKRRPVAEIDCAGERRLRLVYA